MTRARNRIVQPQFVELPSVHMQVIDVVMDNAYDAHGIVRLLAKEQPALFLALHARTQANVADRPWITEVHNAAVAGNHVGGIKALRAAQGWGLKEAKDTYDAFRQGLASRGLIPTAPEVTGALSDSHRAVANKMLDMVFHAHQVKR